MMLDPRVLAICVCVISITSAGIAEDPGAELNVPVLKKVSKKMVAVDREALGKVRLSRDASEGEVRAYLWKIERISRKQSVFRKDDPQVQLLKACGRPHVMTLMEFLGTSLRFHALLAIEDLAEDGDKQVILAALPEKLELVSVVVAKRWTEEAREILTGILGNSPYYLPKKWVDAVVSFEDPSTYEALTNYFVFGVNRNHTYGAILKLPGFSVDDAVARAWEVSRKNLSLMNERAEIALIAVGHGHLDALEQVVRYVDDVRLRDRAMKVIHQYYRDELPENIENLEEWFGKIKHRIVWDRGVRSFAVR